ncbi:MAG: hypothetical protein JNL70_23670 [Saprospiraceae bacterium]|nr:hypothetical protein [Saprospiraceae bacterium]
MDNSIINEGIIEIIKIKNTGKNARQIGTLTGRFVRYPNAQQLSVWLPENGWQGYGNLRIINTKTNTIFEEQTVTNKLNGSVLMTWGTLAWLPSTYCLEIEHPKGGLHCLYFNKLEEDEVVPKDKIVEMETAYAGKPSLASSLLPKKTPKVKEGEDSMWRVYKDGFGNPIPNLDRGIRDNAMASLNEIFNTAPKNEYARLEYENMGRGGYVTYVEADIRIRLWHEIGGGDCHWYIETPKPEDWEKETKTPLSRRRDILLFIANTVRRDQGPSWRFEIRDTEIAYY